LGPNPVSVTRIGRQHAPEGQIRGRHSTTHTERKFGLLRSLSVLKYLFAAAQAASVAVGLRGFTTKFATIKDRDVSAQVNGHSEYFQNVRLA
jgi:hypothetical protein